ncbi:YceI family protein [Botrimarina sp.]|uniref:YceI family protein n=1 Tax=Botrimarina sp. TaxID=2795802 RepID=UPI0032ECF5D5
MTASSSRRFVPPTLLLALVAGAAQAASYQVDPSHTSVVFSISHMGLSYTYGMFRECSGQVDFDSADPSAARFRLTIPVASIDTMNAKRDEHLQAADFFDAEKFPQIAFESTSVEPTTGPDGKPLYNVTGKLTLHGVTKEVTLPVRLLGESSGPSGGPRVGFHCQTTLKRSDFGMSGGIPAIGDSVGVTVSFECVPPQP